jgi:long-subunit fatty acid transport protein
LAEVATASATCRHWEGVQAGVCQRIFSFTEQIVLVKQLSVCGLERSGAGEAAAPGEAEATSAAETRVEEVKGDVRTANATIPQDQCF